MFDHPGFRTPRLRLRALRLQVGDVAVDGAGGHLQPLGQEFGGGQPSPAHELDDLEQAVGTSHGSIVNTPEAS